MKIFVDDIRPAPAGWERAKTVTEAVRKLATAPEAIEAVSLDHDIRDSAETFEPVAYFIMARVLAGMAAPKVYIHTGNFDAGESMAFILKRANIPVEMLDCGDIYRVLMPSELNGGKQA